MIAVSLDPVFIKLCVEADDEAVLDPVGRCAQVSARPHRLGQDRLLTVGRSSEVLHLLPLGNSHGFCRFQQFPRGVLVKAGLLGIDDLFGTDLFGLKKLLSIFTGGSTFAQVGPIDFHNDLLSVPSSSIKDSMAFALEKGPALYWPYLLTFMGTRRTS